jgi:hypothetical protein
MPLAVVFYARDATFTTSACFEQPTKTSMDWEHSPPWLPPQWFPSQIRCCSARCRPRSGHRSRRWMLWEPLGPPTSLLPLRATPCNEGSEKPPEGLLCLLAFGVAEHHLRPPRAKLRDASRVHCRRGWLGCVAVIWCQTGSNRRTRSRSLATRSGQTKTGRG